MTSTFTRDVATPGGPGVLHWSVPPGGEAAARGVLVLGGGASGQVSTADLDALARALPARGWAVVRYELPWRVAGRTIGPRPPASDPAWVIGVDAVRAACPGVPVVTGGRSAGARIACRTWGPDLAGLVCLSFPLHPPGKPAASRLGELQPVGVPVLLVSGARDPFGSPDEFSAALAAGHDGPRDLVVVPGATHSFPARTAGAVVEAVTSFLDLLAG